MIKKAVILAAGKGTRMNAITRGASKEMLMLKNKPVIAYTIHEALTSGCTQIAVVLNKSKDDLYQYIVKEQERGLPISFIFREPCGIMDAINAAEDFANKEQFAVLLPDMLHFGEIPAIKATILASEQLQSNIIALVEEKPYFGAGAYAKTEQVGTDTFIIKDILVSSKSNLRFFGRYVFMSKIFDYLHSIPCEESEAVLLNALILDGALHGFLLKGTIFDVGIPEGYLAAKSVLEEMKNG